MNKLFLFLTMISIAAVGCDSSSADTGGGEPKCKTPQEMIRCDKVVNIAHRGGRRIRPEHTLLAYDQALEDGTDILELDVHETSDGMLVVMHDSTVDRTTSCTGDSQRRPSSRASRMRARSARTRASCSGWVRRA